MIEHNGRCERDDELCLSFRVSYNFEEEPQLIVLVVCQCCGAFIEMSWDEWAEENDLKGDA